MGIWEEWIGRTEIRTDRIGIELVRRWCATFDRAMPEDDSVPQGIHWCLGLPDAATAGLGPDGHPRRDDGPESFLPPVPLPRRMWASSEIEFLAPLRPDEAIHRESHIVSITEKSGGSGQLLFVDIEHATHGQAGLAVRDKQTIVYREAAPDGAAPVPPLPGDRRFDASSWKVHRAVVPNEPLLFRYSALTFNSHRIHYDLAYAFAEEGYRGLVVHGPLTATLLLDLARRAFGENRLSRFAFRGVSPAICGEPLHLVLRENNDGIELSAFAPDGRQIMSANAAL